MDENLANVDPDPPRRVRIFCDSDVLIAGAASTTGASHILLRLSELTVLECLTSQYALKETERNLAAKLPAALAMFRLIVDAAVTIVADASPAAMQTVVGQAHAKDVPILASALQGEADFLATFNLRHFRARKTPPLILRPGDILSRVRKSLAHLLN